MQVVSDVVDLLGRGIKTRQEDRVPFLAGLSPDEEETKLT